MRVAVASVCVNAALFAFKLIAGILSGSVAMISDAAHTVSDLATTLIVIAGYRLSRKKSDRSHPYGHERFECVAAIMLSVVLAVTGGLIGWNAIGSITSGSYRGGVQMGGLALSAAVVSIVLKEVMFHIVNRTAKRINSSSLRADAWHSRSDGISSIGSFAGILGAMLGAPILDPIMGIFVCLMILFAAVTIFRESVKKMTDEAADEETESKILKLATEADGVLGVKKLQTRKFGDRLYVELELEVDGTLSVAQAHSISEAVHNSIEAAFLIVKHCIVLTVPAKPPQA